MPDWMSPPTLVALVSGIVSLIGFGVMIWQLFRTANAAEATQAAVERTEQRMALNHLLVLLPQLRVLEGDLDAAAESNDRQLAIRSLVNYSHVASEVAGLLLNQDGVDGELVVRLRDSARGASVTKAQLIDDDTKMAKTVTRRFRQELAEVTSYMGGLVGRFRIEAGR